MGLNKNLLKNAIGLHFLLAGPLILIIAYLIARFMLIQVEPNFSKFGARQYSLSLVLEASFRELIPLFLGGVYSLVTPMVAVLQHKQVRVYRGNVDRKEMLTLLRRSIALSCSLTFPVLAILGCVVTLLSAYQISDQASLGLQLALRNFNLYDLCTGLSRMIIFPLVPGYLSFSLIKRLDNGFWTKLWWVFVVILLSNWTIVVCSMLLKRINL